ncbi:MAG: hypothetical protein IPK94_15305 [Saprospiraceae bacterium]|nr:hypothetical protein [Saprospiraceae bacterium]MBK8281440.1 hypothetical protein [Saprospiraceae bacterium]MBK8514257.1 hypothetical protein [Saprospiraceae bacterium]MBK9929332.1 hypothetical protein [Saprospiraceae bacterium]MBL0112306.1 hypothetical protein [Saprospiraceae bacterium]
MNKGKSYFSEVLLETVSSDFSTSLSVCMTHGRYQLYTDKVVYSYEDLYKNFKITADKIDWKAFRPKNILVLGLGLGSVIQIIEKKNKQPLFFTAVDIDEAVLYLVQKYTASKFRSPIEYIHADAQIFIAQNNVKYDLILFDIFIDDLVPPKFETLVITKKLASALAPNGLLLYNRIAIEPEHIMRNMDYFDRVFNKVFPQAEFVNVKYNWVLVSDGSRLKKGLIV